MKTVDSLITTIPCDNLRRKTQEQAAAWSKRLEDSLPVITEAFQESRLKDIRYWKLREKEEMQYLFAKNVSAFLDKALGNKKRDGKGRSSGV